MVNWKWDSWMKSELQKYILRRGLRIKKKKKSTYLAEQVRRIFPASTSAVDEENVSEKV